MEMPMFPFFIRRKSFSSKTSLYFTPIFDIGEIPPTLKHIIIEARRRREKFAIIYSKNLRKMQRKITDKIPIAFHCNLRLFKNLLFLQNLLFLPPPPLINQNYVQRKIF